MDASHRDDVRLHLVKDALRRRALLVLIIALLTTAAAAAYARTLPSTYTTSATVLLKAVPGNPLSPDTATTNGAQLTVAMQTEAGLVDTPAVSTLASKALKRSVPASGDALTATVPSGTQIIQVAYTSNTPQHARDGAQAFAEQFLAYRAQRAAAFQKDSLGSLSKQASAADAALKKATTAAAGSTDVRSYAAQQVQLYADRLASLNDAISSASSVSLDPGSVVTAALVPTSPDGVDPLFIIIAGALLGLIAGVLLAVWREWRADLVHTSVELDVAGLPVFATLPKESRRSPLLISERGQDDAIHEAYRRLRAAVVATTRPPRVLAVSGLRKGETTSTLAANLGVALAQAGFRVALVAADDRDAMVETLFGLPQTPGLADLMADALSLEDVTHEVAGLRVLTRGTDPGRAREIFAGPRFTAIVNQLRNECDYVLLAAAPASTADGDSAAATSDAVLLAVTDQVATHDEAESAMSRYRRLGVAALGAVGVPRHARAIRLRRSAGRAGRRPSEPSSPKHRGGTTQADSGQGADTASARTSA